ncbi:MAG: FISUMP domain-containing protein [Candidatus Saccharibacteria bacterium]
MKSKSLKTKNRRINGFTIIEMVIVIVVIGILTAISVVSYNGIQAKARDTTVLADIDNMDEAQTQYGLKHDGNFLVYNSSGGPSSELEFTANDGNVIDVVTIGNEYCIRGYNPDSTKKTINDSYKKESSGGTCDSIVTIGTQTWMAKNLNVGTKIDGLLLHQSDNSILEKYCYDNDENNCNLYGGLYGWDEMMGYTTTEPNQGICPTGFHVPLYSEWATLSTFLGGNSMAGGKLRVGGSSGFNALLSGGIYNHTYVQKGVYGQFFSSTIYSVFPLTEARLRLIDTVNPNLLDEGSGNRNGVLGISVRCIMDQN